MDTNLGHFLDGYKIKTKCNIVKYMNIIYIKQ